MAEAVQQPVVQENDMPERKRDIAARYLYALLFFPSNNRKQGLSEGELALKRAAGLGKVPNVIPEEPPSTNAHARPILVGWHPVGGVAGKWFANDTALGRLITDKINKYPDPTQHWAVLVGDYAHQLWMVSGRKVAMGKGGDWGVMAEGVPATRCAMLISRTRTLTSSTRTRKS